MRKNLESAKNPTNPVDLFDCIVTQSLTLDINRGFCITTGYTMNPAHKKLIIFLHILGEIVKPAFGNDEDALGDITAEELGKVMRSLGQNPTQSQLQDMISELDADHTNSIDFEEFLTLMTATTKEFNPETELRQAFDVFDKDSSGTINSTELCQVMEAIGEKLTDGEIQEMMRIQTGTGQLAVRPPAYI
ncbi:EF-hand [Aspergillus steynii IBT 23096]|uniref:Calmodulin n=1 Tax=Aspergillus steynii IBT 23096 TaxID=1392250 RepID=A0A2I2G5K9_9EURO|nr:EF-hand [Aspergillus steynii IBT 23096]PLB48168.1 EF-hand [Aspergillus steynii IBT 23096]